MAKVIEDEKGLPIKVISDGCDWNQPISNGKADWDIPMAKIVPEFNFVIGKYWNEETNKICPYMIHNNEVHYGDTEYAKKLLKYVQEQEDGDWKIFRLKEVKHV